MSPKEQELLVDSIKAELDSLVKHSYAHVAIAIAFLIYVIERQHQALGQWNPGALPSISVFGLQFSHERLLYAVLLVPILQLFQLRPIQAIADLMRKLGSDSQTARVFLTTRPSVFNPYHAAASRTGKLIDILALIVAAVVMCFFPSVVTMIWLSELLDGDLSFATAAFGGLLLTFMALQIGALRMTWTELLGSRSSRFRVVLFFLSAIAVGIGTYAAAT